jgi:hypothetical protein
LVDEKTCALINRDCSRQIYNKFVLSHLLKYSGVF